MSEAAPSPFEPADVVGRIAPAGSEADHADSVLVARAQAGDRGSLGQLLRRHERRLYNTVLRMVNHRDDAADILQDAYTKIVEKFDSFRGDAAITTWMTRIVMNQTLDHMRRRMRRGDTVRSDTDLSGRTGDGPGPLERAAVSREADPAADAELRDDHRAALRAVNALDVEFRAVLVLRDIGGLDYEAIGRVLNLPTGTVKSRLFRARLAVREALRDGAAEEVSR